MDSSTTTLIQTVTVVPVPSQPLNALSVLISALHTFTLQDVASDSFIGGDFTNENKTTAPPSLSASNWNQTVPVFESGRPTTTAAANGIRAVTNSSVQSSLLTATRDPSQKVSLVDVEANKKDAKHTRGLAVTVALASKLPLPACRQKLARGRWSQHHTSSPCSSAWRESLTLYRYCEKYD